MQTKGLSFKQRKLILIGGCINVGFAIFHCWIAPRHFDWIAFFLLFFAFLCFFHTKELITTRIGRTTIIFNSSLYIIRILMFIAFFIISVINEQKINFLQELLILIFCIIGAICLIGPVILYGIDPTNKS